MPLLIVLLIVAPGRYKSPLKDLEQLGVHIDQSWYERKHWFATPGLSNLGHIDLTAILEKVFKMDEDGKNLRLISASQDYRPSAEWAGYVRVSFKLTVDYGGEQLSFERHTSKAKYKRALRYSIERTIKDLYDEIKRRQ